MRPAGLWRWLLVGSLLLNVCLLSVGGYVLYRKGGMRYLRNYRAIVKGDAVTIDNFPLSYRQELSQFWSQPPTATRVILAGDSLTENHDWTAACGSDVLNRGISGDTTVGLLFRLGEILRHRPGKLFLLIGISDLRIWRGSDQVLRTYEQILRQIRDDAPGTTVFVQSILPINPRMFGSEIDPREIRRVNEGLRPLSEQYGARYLDLYSRLLDGEVLDPRLTREGVHLLPEGYARWESALREAGCGS